VISPRQISHMSDCALDTKVLAWSAVGTSGVVLAAAAINETRFLVEYLPQEAPRSENTTRTGEFVLLLHAHCPTVSGKFNCMQNSPLR
jgi:hypothetical protein